MIQKEELRIGNWVRHEILGNDVLIGISDNIWEEIEPIPLLLEHLQESPSLTYDSENGWFVSKHDADITIEHSNDTGAAIYVNDKLINMYKHVHELQNAYYWITGKNEIEIEL